jgi:outer membrane protein OmpA-like peptidoglycan-associated protein
MLVKSSGAKNIENSAGSRGVRFGILAIAMAVAGCIAPYDANNAYPFGQRPGLPPPSSIMRSASLTVGLENADRSARFRRLASLSGITQPSIEEIVVQPERVIGLDHPVPVLRISFDEKILFDFKNDQTRPEAEIAIDLIADSMRRDVPDVQLTLVGHTDAIGTDAYNDDISLRRARNVFQALVNLGLNAAQLSTVAVGKRQPIAPNSTQEGRARNRRVELLISASLDANLAVVRLRPVNVTNVSLVGAQSVVTTPSVKVAVMRPQTYNGPSDVSEATPHGTVKLQAIGSVTLTASAPSPPPAQAIPVTPPIANTPAAEPDIKLNKPSDFELAPLGPAIPL